MRRVVKRGLRTAAQRLGIYDLARRLTGEWPRILVYHAFTSSEDSRDGATTVDSLRRQLAYVRRRYRIVPLAEIGRAIAEQCPLPARSVAITIDDGYVSFAEWALPVLREFEAPATVFVVSELVERRDWLWYDKFRYLCAAASDRDAHGSETNRTILARLKRLPPDQRDAECVRIAREAGVSIPRDPPPDAALLDWRQLCEIAADGLIDIGAHTRTHPILATIPEQAARDEIAGSREQIRRRLGVDAECFCYPNGLPGDYRPLHMRQVAESGFLCAVASHCGIVTPGESRFALPRIGASNDFNLFRKLLDGFQHVQDRLHPAKRPAAVSQPTASHL
ncbi:MAG: hypothetical protein D6744_09655 [Planctomycetota bacterium]|nr:MAG: hypothetical protein D6744_09655 [Planctomycetota bacterium]